MSHSGYLVHFGGLPQGAWTRAGQGSHAQRDRMSPEKCVTIPAYWADRIGNRADWVECEWKSMSGHIHQRLTSAGTSTGPSSFVSLSQQMADARPHQP